MPSHLTAPPIPFALFSPMVAKSVARLEDGSPASPVGELIDVIVKEVETANQSNSQGATDADAPAVEGQAKEGAWELFTG